MDQQGQKNSNNGFLLRRNVGTRRSVSYSNGLMKALNLCNGQSGPRNRSLSSSPKRQKAVRKDPNKKEESEPVNVPRRMDEIAAHYRDLLNKAQPQSLAENAEKAIQVSSDNSALDSFKRLLAEKEALIGDLKKELDTSRDQIKQLTVALETKNKSSNAFDMASELRSVRSSPVHYEQPLNRKYETFMRTPSFTREPNTIRTPATSELDLAYLPRSRTAQSHGGEEPLRDVERQVEANKTANHNISRLIRPRFSFIRP